MKKLRMVAISALLLMAGAVAGQVLLVRAEAQTGTYRECVATTLWVTSGKTVNAGEKFDKTVRVPQGWSVLGAGGTFDGYPTMLLCR